MSKTKKSKKQNYSVLVTGYCSVLVEGATSEEDAFEIAKDEMSTGDFQVDEIKIETTIPDDALDSARGCHDLVSKDDE